MYTNLNYVRPGKNLKKLVTKSIDYMAHRVGADGEKMERILFGHGGPLTAEQVTQTIKDAPTNTYFWRLKISPDVNKENKDQNLDLWELTKKLLSF